MGNTTKAILAALSLSIVACDDATGPTGPKSETFAVSGVVATGLQIEIKGVNGNVTASAATGTQFAVSTVQRGNEDDPADVHIDVVEHAGGVTICAVYPDVPGQSPNVCAPGNEGHLSVENNDVQVDFTVSVPSGVVFVGRNVNGDVAATNLEANAFVSTVNGNVDLSTLGLGTASTVNGNVTAEIGMADWDRNLAFTTVNGNVTAQVPPETNAEAQLTTVNGAVSSDFPLDQISERNLQGTLGSGGNQLTLSSVNGNVTLRRGS